MRNKRVRALVPRGTSKKERRVIKQTFKRGEPSQFTEVVHPTIVPTYWGVPPVSRFIRHPTHTERTSDSLSD